MVFPKPWFQGSWSSRRSKVVLYRYCHFCKYQDTMNTFEIKVICNCNGCCLWHDSWYMVLIIIKVDSMGGGDKCSADSTRRGRQRMSEAGYSRSLQPLQTSWPRFRLTPTTTILQTHSAHASHAPVSQRRD